MNRFCVYLFTIVSFVCRRDTVPFIITLFISTRFARLALDFRGNFIKLNSFSKHVISKLYPWKLHIVNINTLTYKIPRICYYCKKLQNYVDILNIQRKVAFIVKKNKSMHFRDITICLKAWNFLYMYTYAHTKLSNMMFCNRLYL